MPRGWILERNWNKSLNRVFLLAIHSQLCWKILLPPPPTPLDQKWFETALQCKHCKRKRQVWELSRLCPETSTKFYLHEFGFRAHMYYRTVIEKYIQRAEWQLNFRNIRTLPCMQCKRKFIMHIFISNTDVHCTVSSLHQTSELHRGVHCTMYNNEKHNSYPRQWEWCRKICNSLQVYRKIRSLHWRVLKNKETGDLLVNNKKTIS
jgi:hypothetical protein